MTREITAHSAQLHSNSLGAAHSLDTGISPDRVSPETRPVAGYISPRRTACDRCRGHKLRCIRHDNGEDTCRRCLKSGSACTTSATARIGRPPTVPRPQNQYRNESQTGSVIPSEMQFHEVQVPTPASTARDDRTEPCISVTAEDDFRDTRPADTISPASTYTTGLSSVARTPLENRGLPDVETISLDVLDPSTLPALPPPIDLREECVRKLAGLHSNLVLDLNIVRCCRTADKCTAITSMPEFAQDYNFTIGRMLSSSNKFVEVLRYFTEPDQTQSRGQTVRCDIPTLLSIFTCYTYLIRIYRIIFTSIYKSIVDPPAPPEKLPPLFPGLHLGGYSLEPHIGLQVKVLVSVSEKMLADIDQLIGLGAAEPTGLIKNAGVSVEILQLMLEKELAEEHEDGVLVEHQKPLSDILDSLRVLT